jgi:fructose-1,6-bisphosphatase/sedoheptulose 1,7-bisphosphatase-like protein
VYAKRYIIAYTEVLPMPLLQLLDIPEDLYQNLARAAKAENRSITQETIVLLRQALNINQERTARRKQVLKEIKELGSKINASSLPDPSLLIRYWMPAQELKLF